jgi:hypothetical protein
MAKVKALRVKTQKSMKAKGSAAYKVRHRKLAKTKTNNLVEVPQWRSAAPPKKTPQTTSAHSD